MNTAIFLLSKITTGKMNSSTTIKSEQDGVWHHFPTGSALGAMEAKLAVEKWSSAAPRRADQ